MPKQATLRKVVVAIALGTSAVLIAAAPASAHGCGGGGHSGGSSAGFVNTIHPIVRSPIVNTIHPIVRGPIVNTIHPIIATTTIVRDHRTGLYGYGRRCGGSYNPCLGEGGLGFGQKPAQLPYGYQLPQGGQVRDHRS
jgi:hypothetical protein